MLTAAARACLPPGTLSWAGDLLSTTCLVQLFFDTPLYRVGTTPPGWFADLTCKEM